MTSIASGEAAPHGLHPALRVFGLRLACAVALVALGDFLWRGPAGASLVLLVLSVAIATIVTNARRIQGRTLALAFAALVAGALPLVMDVGILPVLFAAGGLAVFALLLTGQGTPGWLRRPVDAALLWFSGPRRLFWDCMVALEALAETGWGRSIFSVARLAGWIVPVGLLGVFLILFADANPVMLRGLMSLDPAAWLPRFEFSRVFTWIVILLLVWPFLHVRLMPKAWSRALAGFAPQPARPSADSGRPSVSLQDLLLSREAVLRSLVLFNLLFAMQTGLDALYLWGGAALPEGMTYASYAHRGAYPLIVTALLAATFVLVAMRPNGPAGNSSLLRGLVHLFVAQNVGLVLSAILRLDLYVSVYSLTDWRVAAFIWMGLVAIGLVLIAARIALRQSNSWLVGANLIAATATLYCCCFVNFAALIANYNVDHFAKGTSRSLDLPYLASLGPDAIPAIDRALPTVPREEVMFRDRRYDAPVGAAAPGAEASRLGWLLAARKRLAAAHETRMSDWRGWTLRGQRLSAYLATQADAAPSEPRNVEPVTPAPPAVPAPFIPVEPAPSAR